jgi:hypothetical protein
MEMLSGIVMVFTLMGGQLSLPLGLPPLPEDPVLANVAPEDCLFYYTWSGVAEPDPKSKNQTEQLLAESEVKEFIAGVGKALGAAIKKGAPATPQGQVLGVHGPKLIRILLTHPTAIFATKVDDAAGGVGFIGGLVLATGNETEAVKSSLGEIEKVFLAGETPTGDSKWHTVPGPHIGQSIEWGFRGNYLIVGVGAGSADAIAGRLHGKPPSWLTALRKKLTIERVSTVLYLNIKSLDLDHTRMPGESELRPFLGRMLGLTNVTALGTISGLDSTSFVSKSWIQTQAAPGGLLSIFGHKALKPSDLAPVPKDASFAVVARLDSAHLYEAAVQIEKRFILDFAAANADHTSAETLLGFRLKDDLLDALGDVWSVYNSPEEGGLLITGLTLVVPVKDVDRLRKTNDRLVELASQSGLTAGPVLKKSTFRGQKIFFLQSSGNEFFPSSFAPAWCVSDTHLIVALSPQNVRAFLSRDPAAGSLADVPVVAEKLKSGSPVLVTYQDTAAELKVVYPLLQIMAGIFATSLEQEGLDLDLGLLPSLASIVRHVEPGIGTLSVEPDGLVYVNRQSLPIGMALPSWTLWMGFALAARPVIFPAFELQAVRVENVDGIVRTHAIRVERRERLLNR